MFLALLISVLVALTTGLGGLLATHRKLIDRSILAVSLAFAAGAMLFVTLVELLPHGLESQTMGDQPWMAWPVYGMFFLGIVIVALIDHFLPPSFNPSEIEGGEDRLDNEAVKANKQLFRSGVAIAIVLALHNLPEGLSTFLASYSDLAIGIPLAIGIAVHNIPLGIAIAAPIYAATKNRRKAILWASLAGAVEIIGALIGVLLVGAISESLLGLLFALVAGMIIFVIFDEMLPAAKRYETNDHQVIYGVVLGMLVVAISLLMVGH